MDRGKRRGRKRRHDWLRLFLRREFKLLKGLDYDCSSESMEQQVRNAASILGHSVSVRTAEGGIEVEVVEVS